MNMYVNYVPSFIAAINFRCVALLYVW